MSNQFSKTAIASVALMKIKGIGRRAAVRIVNGAIEDDEDERTLFDRAARNKVDTGHLRETWKQAEDQLDQSAASGISSVAFHDPTFPSRLRSIPDPPAVLFIKGKPPELSAPNTLAIVGTREPTEYGERVTQRLAASAVNMGFVIVSGLAHGCDTLAHKGCVEANGVGIAVLAHGLDKVYPAANKGLAQQLLDIGGCLVSEYPLGMTPMKTAFAERDRLQSGLSDGVFVIETDVKGGTMHTVRFARQQHRALACIDHPDAWRRAPKAQGNRLMIADRWAEPIADSNAFTEFLLRLKSRQQTDREPSGGDSDPQISMGF
ncbi:DNA-processing protein DprA [Ensifer canadensis]